MGDGVLVVTVPKEKRITELKEDNKIKMQCKKSVEKKEESKSADQIKVEQRSGASAESTENKARTTSVVPMNLRESFFDDPFFKDSWLDIQQSQRDFFSKAEERFNQQMKMFESARDNFGSLSLTNLKKDFDLDLRDAEELKVTAGRGVVCVEGKHEEKSQSGEVMVSRQMSRQYQLPSSADQQPLQGRRPPRHRTQDTTDQQPGQECSHYDEVKRWIFMTEVELKIFLH